jgi:hypothetical protein
MLDESTIAELEELDINLTEVAMIKKVGSQWCVFSADGSKRLGCYSSRPAAEKRLAQIEMFRHMKKGEVDFEISSQSWCYCSCCGAEYVSNKRCDLSTCPVCGDNSCSYELTGLID